MANNARKKTAHPKNVEGDFYVEDGCCTLCGVPQHGAPDLFSAIDDEAAHCYVKKQPENGDELSRMIDVTYAAELACIRYAGTDSAIIDRIDFREICDNPPAEPAAPPPSLENPPRQGPLRRWLSRLFGSSDRGSGDA